MLVPVSLDNSFLAFHKQGPLNIDPELCGNLTCLAVLYQSCMSADQTREDCYGMSVLELQATPPLPVYESFEAGL